MLSVYSSVLNSATNAASEDAEVAVATGVNTLGIMIEQLERKGHFDPDTVVAVCHSVPYAWTPADYGANLCPPEEEPTKSPASTAVALSDIASRHSLRNELRS